MLWDFSNAETWSGLFAKSRTIVQCCGLAVETVLIRLSSGRRHGEVFVIIWPDLRTIEMGILHGRWVSTSRATRHLGSAASTQKCRKA